MRAPDTTTSFTHLHQPMPVGVVSDAVRWHGTNAGATKRARIRAGGLATAGGTVP